MQVYAERASLEGLEINIFKLVSHSATPEQWKEWLRVPLEHAAARGNLDLFNKLLGAGADGSAGCRGCRGRTLLDAAAVGGNEDIVSGLLRVGAQPDVNVVSCSSKRSALYTATMLGHEAVARLLVIAGADVNTKSPVVDRSVLHEAVRGGHRQLAKDLLLTGATVDARDEEGASPLHIAASKGSDGIVSTLLLRGADKNALDFEGETPLMCASRRSRLTVVNTLLAAGADASIRSNDQFSALDNAAMKGHDEVIRAIADHGVDVNARDGNGYTALHIAAKYDRAGTVDVLVAAGADIHLNSESDVCCPLSHAAIFGSCKAMLALLRHGAKVDVRNNDGDTPLHIACSERCEGLGVAVDLLLRSGADETALNNDGKRPAEMLDLENDEMFDNPATQVEINRTRCLLSRAPADRAWRRRGWLIMLRSRAQKARTASSCGAARAALDVVSTCKEFRDDTGHRKRDRGVDALGGAGGDTPWRDVVALLTGLEMEGVFRTVIGFL